MTVPSSPNAGAPLTEAQIAEWRRRIREETFANYNFRMGEALARTGDAPGAIAQLKRALEIRPDYPEAHRTLRRTLLEAGRGAEADEAHRTALAVRPDYEVEALIEAAWDQLSEGRPAAAEPLLREAAALAPNHPRIRLGLCVLSVHQGRPLEAMAELRAVPPGVIGADLAAFMANVFNIAGSLDMTDGRPDAAALWYEHILALPPGTPTQERAAGKLANIRMLQGRLGDAEVMARQAIERSPRQIDAHVSLGCTLLLQRRWEEAADAFRTVADIAPDYPVAPAYLGLARHAQGRLDEATALYRKALSMDRTSSQSIDFVGLAAHARGEYGAAEAAYRHALCVLPDNASFLLHLGHLCWETGRRPEAETCMRRAHRLQASLLWIYLGFHPWAGDRLRAIFGAIGMPLADPSEA